MFHLTVFS